MQNLQMTKKFRRARRRSPATTLSQFLLQIRQHMMTVIKLLLEERLVVHAMS